MQLISTMATPLLVFGARAVFEAIDPVTGAPVAGVKLTNPVLAGINLSDNTPQLPPSTVEPLWLPIPTDQVNAAG